MDSRLWQGQMLTSLHRESSPSSSPSVVCVDKNRSTDSTPPPYIPGAAVFSTQGSPFLEVSSFQSHYYPSRAQLLSQTERSTVLSPSRLQKKNHATSSKEVESLSPPLLNLLLDSSRQGANPSSLDSESPFNESWPSTERSSSSQTPEGAKTLPSEKTSGTKSSPELQGSIASFSDSESVVARYIKRFRYGQPTNRRERWTPNSHSAPFWWLGQSSESNSAKMEVSPFSSTHRKHINTLDAFVKTDSCQHEGRPSSSSPELNHSPSGESQDFSTLDPDTVSLQERAARLLCRSMSPLSSCRHMSSEGLCSSTPTSTTANTDVNVVGQASKPLMGHQQQASLGAVSSPIAQIPSSCSSLKPEDDILFQWRLRRKMEEASRTVAVLPSVGWRTQWTEPAYPHSMMGRATLKSPEPMDGKVLPTSKAQLGLTLSGPPCCCTYHLRSGPASQQPVKGSLFSGQNAMDGSSKPIKDQGAKEPVMQEVPIPACLDFLPPPRPAEATKPLDLKLSDHPQRTTWTAQKVHTEPKGKQKPFRAERGRPKPARDSAKPSVSPGKHVQRVLGEVVAERLFSPESPAPQRSKLKRSARKQGLKESLPGTVATPSYPELLNLAAQLLEQAEESDGTEFEDDPLLQVLRTQRDLLRRQLRDVDAQVAQLERSHSDLNFSHS